MRFHLLLSALPIALTLMTGGVAAKTGHPSRMDIYECTFVGGEVDWIKDTMWFIRDYGNNRTMVIDPVIDRVFKDLIPAKVTVETSTRLEFEWTVGKLKGTRGTATIDFHAVFLIGDQQISEKAVVRGYDNKESRQGTCKLTK